MIILDFFRQNIKGSIISIRMKSYSTGYFLYINDEKLTQVKDLVIEGIQKED